MRAVREAERVRLKEALQAKRIELLEEVFRTAPSFLHVLRGPDFIFEFANDAYYQLVGQARIDRPPGVRGAARRQRNAVSRTGSPQVMSTCKPFVGFELPVKLSRGAGSTGGRALHRSRLFAAAG